MPEKLLHNEPDLIREMQAGCQQAFTAIYRHYSPHIYMNIVRMVHDSVLAEELVQELFTRIWQKRESRGIAEDFQGYMYRIAQNLVFDFFRKMKKDRLLLEKFKSMASEVDNSEAMEDMLDQRQSIVIINNAIEHLPPQQKKVYKLVKQEGYTYKKAAEEVGISPFTVKEYLSLANKSIRNYLIHHSDAPRELLLVALIFFSLQ
ncbi:MAG: sigma-70 family RNA polymerase sigma factor [Chitinophagaceae bacterium]|nr:sigma-70 family RNA polymerase sigma factor [Chitinophagaceae bacterium]